MDVNTIKNEDNKTCPFILSPKNKILVYGSKGTQTKELMNFLLNDGNEVAYLSFSELTENDIYTFPIGIYIIKGNDRYISDYLKSANTLIFYCQDSCSLKDTVDGFYSVYNLVEKYNKNINFVLVSTTEVYGRKINGMLFADSRLNPSTQKGKEYEIMEYYTYRLPSYKIIRISELYTDKVKKEISDFIDYIKKLHVVKIPQNKEYINFVYPETLYKAIKILMNSQNQIVIHLTDTPSLTFQTFIHTLATLYNKKIKTSTKIQSMFMVFSKNIPNIFKYDQNLSTIEQESFGLTSYKSTTGVVKDLVDMAGKQ
jgi:hypothetical protein